MRIIRSALGVEGLKLFGRLVCCGGLPAGERVGLPRPLDLPNRREAPRIPKPREKEDKAVKDKAEEMDCDSPSAPALVKGQDKEEEEAKGGDTEEKGEGGKDKAALPAGLLSLTCYGSSDEDSEEGQAAAQEGEAPKAGDQEGEEAQREPVREQEEANGGQVEGVKEEDEEAEGDAEERLVDGWRQGAEAPVCLPTLALVHHTLMCAGSEGAAGGGLVKGEGEEGGWGEGAALGVSMQATATLHSAAQVHTTRITHHHTTTIHT